MLSLLKYFQYKNSKSTPVKKHKRQLLNILFLDYNFDVVYLALIINNKIKC